MDILHFIPKSFVFLATRLKQIKAWQKQNEASGTPRKHIVSDQHCCSCIDCRVTSLENVLTADTAYEESISVTEVGGHHIGRHTGHGLRHLPDEKEVPPFQGAHAILHRQCITSWAGSQWRNKAWPRFVISFFLSDIPYIIYCYINVQIILQLETYLPPMATTM